MKPKRIGWQQRRGERGQTIILVAISIVSLLAMAALAIDVVSLYVARSEVQRAADAAALVGAKAIADSGVTSLPPGDPNAAAAKTLAQSMANSAITALLSASPALNQVAGSPPVLIGGTPTIVYNDPSASNLTNDAIITVTLQRTGLPTFFAKVFGQTASTTSATAVAEAYNPANMQNFTPVTPRCVKPWLVGNADPIHSGVPFVIPSTGAVPNVASLIGQSFYLTADCNGTPAAGCSPPLRDPPDVVSGYLQYVPALITANPANVCSSSCGGTSDYEHSIQCCDVNAYSCGGNSTNAAWDPAINPNPNYNGNTGATAIATECLIHATSFGQNQGQDLINDFIPWPTSGAPQITAGSGPMNGQLVTTSSSIVTIPIIDTSVPKINIPPYSVTVIGFLQAFVRWVDAGVAGHHADIYITVLNVVGCSQTPNLNPPIIGGNGASAIAVRLITPPPPP